MYLEVTTHTAQFYQCCVGIRISYRYLLVISPGIYPRTWWGWEFFFKKTHQMRASMYKWIYYGRYSDAYKYVLGYCILTSCTHTCSVAPLARTHPISLLSSTRYGPPSSARDDARRPPKKYLLPQQDQRQRWESSCPGNAAKEMWNRNPAGIVVAILCFLLFS